MQTQKETGLTLEVIRTRLRERYERAPQVRITVQMPHTKVVQDASVTITGVYPHVFCVEEIVGGTMQRHAFQYADVLTRRVEVEGLL